MVVVNIGRYHRCQGMVKSLSEPISLRVVCCGCVVDGSRKPKQFLKKFRHKWSAAVTYDDLRGTMAQEDLVKKKVSHLGRG